MVTLSSLNIIRINSSLFMLISILENLISTTPIPNSINHYLTLDKEYFLEISDHLFSVLGKVNNFNITYDKIIPYDFNYLNVLYTRS